MRTARRTFVATGTVAVLAAAGVTAAIAADPAPPPPPRIAFLANGIVPADALAAGPIAGQLGAPIYTTQPDALSSAAATGLDAYDPELVIVLGGPVAIHDTVIDQVEAATDLTESAEATPTGGIVRAAGGDRFDTAAEVAELLAAYNPAYLPIDVQAIDADTLDGKEATDFLAADGKAQTAGHADTAGDADTLDGKEATEFGPATGSADVAGSVDADGTLVFGTDNIDSVHYDETLQRYFVEFSSGSFSESTDIAVVTVRNDVGSGDSVAVARYAGYGPHLTVHINEPDGPAVKRPFNFAVYDAVG